MKSAVEKARETWELCNYGQHVSDGQIVEKIAQALDSYADEKLEEAANLSETWHKGADIAEEIRKLKRGGE